MAASLRLAPSLAPCLCYCTKLTSTSTPTVDANRRAAVASGGGELGGNVARCVALMAGLPLATAGTTVNRLCGSSLQALAQAAHAIQAGAVDVQVVGGVEHMHHLPMEAAIDIHPRVLARSSRGMLSMGLTAEQLRSSLEVGAGWWGMVGMAGGLKGTGGVSGGSGD